MRKGSIQIYCSSKEKKNITQKNYNLKALRIVTTIYLLSTFVGCYFSSELPDKSDQIPSLSLLPKTSLLNQTFVTIASTSLGSLADAERGWGGGGRIHNTFRRRVGMIWAKVTLSPVWYRTGVNHILQTYKLPWYHWESQSFSANISQPSFIVTSPCCVTLVPFHGVSLNMNGGLLTPKIINYYTMESLVWKVWCEED